MRQVGFNAGSSGLKFLTCIASPLEINMDKKLALRYGIRETMGLVIMGVALFWSAGRVDWWPGWAALGVMAAWIIATAYVIFRYNPALLAERLGPRKGAKSWDTAIMSILGLSQLARYILAGFDQRYGWTGGGCLWAQIAALGVCFIGYAVVVWATASNAFFSQIMRVQTERSHTVVTNGPYRYIRHPAYSGAILYELAMPALFTSWWSLLPSLLNATLLILRTRLEDRALQIELDGYPDYTQKVHFRLLPGVW